MADERGLPIIPKQPYLTVYTKDGTGYCADNLAICHYDGYYCLSFICSGAMTIKRVSEIARVEFGETGAQHCNHCDGRLTAIPYKEFADIMRQQEETKVAA